MAWGVLRRTLLLPAFAALAGLPFGVAPAWAQAQPDARMAGLARLAARLRGLDADGLNPADYAIPADDMAASDLAGYVDQIGRSAARALTDLLHGRIASLPGRVDILRDRAALPLEPWLAELAGSADPAGVLDRAALLPPDAAALKAALAEARQRAALTFAPIPGGAALSDTIEPGAWDSVKIPLLRARMALTDPGVRRDAGNNYDASLVEAVKRFQASEGLEADGRIGRITLAALNRPLSAQLAQLRANLDMRRAAAVPGPERRVEVNIAHQRLAVIEAGRNLLEMNVIVGKPARPTPMLRVRLTAIQFNPRWGVPIRNMKEDLLPRFRRDARAMMEKGFRVYSVVNGQAVEIDATTIEWSRVNPERIPYIIRQDAGEANALGRIKFVIPNSDDIFMHDTPDRHLFRRPDRAFSSGCIRLEKPMELLEIAMTGMPGFDRPRIDKLLADRVTAGTAVRQVMPVRLHYTTAVVEDGRVALRPDIYGLDEAYARALDAPARMASAGVR
jgi:murein L,D-transpeptidase YcbB/YkuD